MLKSYLWRTKKGLKKVYGKFYKEMIDIVTIYCYNVTMNKKEYVLYRGEKFTVEWYFTIKGKSQPFDYFNKLASQQQMKLLYLVKRMGDFGKIADKTKFNFEHDGIWAFKPKPDRFLSFFTSKKKIIITNAFEKKCDKLPSIEKDKAEKCRIDYEMRVQEGTYYDNI